MNTEVVLMERKLTFALHSPYAVEGTAFARRNAIASFFVLSTDRQSHRSFGPISAFFLDKIGPSTVSISSTSRGLRKRSFSPNSWHNFTGGCLCISKRHRHKHNNTSYINMIVIRCLWSETNIKILHQIYQGRGTLQRSLAGHLRALRPGTTMSKARKRAISLVTYTSKTSYIIMIFWQT